MTKKLSFEEYVQKNERPNCAMCVLPERGEIDAVYRQGKATKRQVADYLHNVAGYQTKTCFGEEGTVLGVSRTMVEHHYAEKHHFSA